MFRATASGANECATPAPHQTSIEEAAADERRAGRTALMIVGGVVAAGMLATMIVLLAMALAVLQDSRSHIESQDAKAGALLRNARPPLRTVRPLIEDARPVVARLPALFDAVGATGEDLEAAVVRLPNLVVSAETLINETVPLVENLSAADPGQTLVAARELIGALTEDDRLIDSLDEGRALAEQGRDFLDQVGNLRLPERAAKSSKRLRLLLEVQRKAYQVQLQSIEIQRQTLVHARSLDRKTGGTFPPP
jgi:hypothetical protein